MLIVNYEEDQSSDHKWVNLHNSVYDQAIIAWSFRWSTTTQSSVTQHNYGLWICSKYQVLILNILLCIAWEDWQESLETTLLRLGQEEISGSGVNMLISNYHHPRHCDNHHPWYQARLLPSLSLPIWTSLAP